MFPFNRLLLKVSGSIAAYKSCELISDLKNKNPSLEIKVVLSQNAHRFVGPEALETLSGNPVHQDIFESGSLMEHIYLARWADAVLVYPASANTIHQLATGRSDSLIGALFLAYDLAEKPYFLAPAMNSKMLSHPSTKEALSKLDRWGLTILPTESGPLACGEVGAGRLLSPQNLSAYFESISKGGKKILVTSGATRESIDGVRFLTNFSTGKTGAKIAETFAKNGDQVHYLHGICAAQPAGRVTSVEYSDFKDLEKNLESLLSQNEFDMIVHAAAVSDYSVTEVFIDGQEHNPNNLKNIKLQTSDKLQIQLTRNPKLISKIHQFSKNPKLPLIGFKLTKSLDKQVQNDALRRIVTDSPADYIVHNDLLEIECGNHEFRIYDRHLKCTGIFQDPEQLAMHLRQIHFSNQNYKMEISP